MVLKVDYPTEVSYLNQATSLLRGELDRTEIHAERIEERIDDLQVREADRRLAMDPEFQRSIEKIGTVEDAANALAVAMTYLHKYPNAKISVDDIAIKMVGHIGATTAISRTWVGLGAALKDGNVRKALERAGVTQSHVVTGPGHGAASVFALHFLEGTLTKHYPDRYPLNFQGMQNLIADFCRPGSPLPSHTFPGIPSISEGGELGYSLGIAAGAGIANADSVVLAQIGDKEAESGPLLASIDNHNAVYDFRKGLVLPVLHANGLGISNTAIISARSNAELRSYLKGLGYSPMIVDAENTKEMKRADRLAEQMETLIEKRNQPGANTEALDEGIERIRAEIVQLKETSAERTNALMQACMRQSIVNLGRKKEKALALDEAHRDLAEARQAVADDPKDAAAQRQVTRLEHQVKELGEAFRSTRTPFIVYREAKGGGQAPVYVKGKRTKGAPPSHQLILAAGDLMAKDPSSRKILERWLGDLTDNRGPAGLDPKDEGLSSAVNGVMPEMSLRPSAAPMATGHTTAELSHPDASAYLQDFEARGTESRRGNDGIDQYLNDYVTNNADHVKVFGGDTMESNRLKRTVATHGRRSNQIVGEHHPGNTGPSGELYDILSEQYLMAMAQGVANTGKQAIISNYEAFFQITSSMVRQYIKFRKQAGEANALTQAMGKKGQYRPPVPNMILHLSSLLSAQDHNGFSHQNPGLVDEMIAEPRKYASVIMPPEANSATLLFDKAAQGKDQVVAIVNDKQPRKQFLKPAEAKELTEKGAAVWDWASDTVAGQKPDVVLAASGGYHTDEVLAAGCIIEAFNRELRAGGQDPVTFQTVNVAEPLKLRAPEMSGDAATSRLAALGRNVTIPKDETVFDQKQFDALFPPEVPVVYNFGGFKRSADDLFMGRGRQVSTHGYINEGSTTTRFDMMAKNNSDRFTLVVDAVEQAFQKGTVSAATRDRVQQWCADQLKAHDARMARGEEADPKSITDGVWGEVKIA